MQRIFPLQHFSRALLLLATLYVSACSTATRPTAPAVPAQTGVPATVAPATPAEPQMTTISPPGVSSTELPAGIPPLPPADRPAPHIALILPLKSTAFAGAANIVQQGFLAAASRQPRDFPVRLYGSADEGKDIIDIYRQALANGAVAVAGPLTRAGVNLLAGYPYIPVPTLAMNIAEQKTEAQKMYFFSLSPEAEARQVAQLAFKNNLRDATIINTGNALSKRLSAAFTEEWKKLGGNLIAEVNFKEGDDTSVLVNLPVAPWIGDPPPPPTKKEISPTGEEIEVPIKRPGPPPVAPGNVAFLAGDLKQARLIRPYLNPSLPVYATSAVFNIKADTLINYDVNEVRFVDMPWLLQPDHAAVMIYPRSTTALDSDKERLYAFGIDAYRLLHIMLHETYNRALPLDGVSGRITMGESNTFLRDAQPAFFRYGRGLTPETLAAYEAERAAARAAEAAARKAAAEAAQQNTPNGK